MIKWVGVKIVTTNPENGDLPHYVMPNHMIGKLSTVEDNKHRAVNYNTRVGHYGGNGIHTYFAPPGDGRDMISRIVSLSMLLNLLP